MEPNDFINDLVARFNKTADRDKKIQRSLKHKKRIILINIIGHNIYYYLLEHTRLTKVDTIKDDPDIKISIDKDTLTSIIDGKVTPMEAYKDKKIVVDASLGDIMIFYKIFRHVKGSDDTLS